MQVIYSELPAGQIVEGIRDKRWGAEEVMSHFLERARAANDATNCVTEFLTEEALDAARKLDKKLSDGEQFAQDEFPLLGLPMSIKDNLDIKGHATVCGYKMNLGKKAESDSACVRLIRECGGIPFCKTSVCQFCMTLESSNPITGTTGNPINPKYTSGGSTSGEGPLLKLKGSVLGVGSDIGGSLRVPAHFCGVCTLKPTSPRIPKLGHASGPRGQEMVKPSLGPISNCVADLDLFMRSLLGKDCWALDPNRIPVPYRPFEIDKKLRVGYIISDGVFPPVPACQRAVMETVNALSADGHHVQVFNFKKMDRMRHFGQALLLADCLSGYLERVQDEGIHPTISNLVRNTQLPNWMKYTLSTLLRYVFRQPLLADTVYNSRRRTVAELWEVLVERQDTFAEFNAEWDSLKLDILILPPLACTAFLHGQMEKITGGLNYSLMANVFDLPAGVLPVTQVDPKLDKLNPHTWYTEQLGPNVTPEWLHTLMYSIYDANAISGFPVGVQVVGRQFEDEKVLAVMQLIESLLNQRKSP